MSRQRLVWRIMAVERRLSGPIIPVKKKAAAKSGKALLPAAVPKRTELPALPPVEAIDIPHLRSAGLFGSAADAPPVDELPGKTKAEKLEALRQWLGECTRCPLHKNRTKVVFGEGNPEARLVFVGEGPGADEDATGRPFVGRAGQLLTKMIEAMGLRREDVYICNVVKCRPPENRVPTSEEAAVCGPVMFRQVEIIRPELVMALGAPALHTLTEHKDGITKMRGRLFRYGGSVLLPTFHPAYLLRNPAEKKTAWLDLKIACAFLGLTPKSTQP